VLDEVSAAILGGVAAENVLHHQPATKLFWERQRPFWSGECAGSAMSPVNLNNANFDTENGVIGPITRHSHK
jgi:hypothetical protein